MRERDKANAPTRQKSHANATKHIKILSHWRGILSRWQVTSVALALCRIVALSRSRVHNIYMAFLKIGSNLKGRPLFYV